MENQIRLFTAIYLSSTLNNVLDDISVHNSYTGVFKSQMNKTKKYLRLHIHSQLNKSYEIDPEGFESLDNYIHNKSLEFERELLENLNKIVGSELVKN